VHADPEKQEEQKRKKPGDDRADRGKRILLAPGLGPTAT
jgi:hypothetical protein